MSASPVLLRLPCAALDASGALRISGIEPRHGLAAARITVNLVNLAAWFELILMP
jgi:hypothetical protein